MYFNKPVFQSYLTLQNIYTTATCLLVCVALTLSGCSKKDKVTPPTGPGTSKIDSTAITSGTPEGSTETGADPDDLIENSTFTSTVNIDFGTSLTITNPLAGSGVDIVQTGSDIVINSSVSGVAYTLSGTTNNGSVKIYSSNKFKLTLNGVNITSNNGPAINIQSKKRAFIVLADGTTNSLTDAASYPSSTEDQKGTVFCEGQMIFTGTGSLTVQGNYKHAICSDDYVRLISGSITVTGAVKDGIHTNNAFIADGGTLNVTASSDGIECEEGYIIINNGNFTMNAVDHGISASYEDGDNTITPYVNINGGTFHITTSAGEGIQSKSNLTINSGNITATTTDDGINADSAIYINGGNLYLVSSTNDGMDSNGIITITGGKTVAIGAQASKMGVNCHTNTLKITGGIVVGTGGETSKPDLASSTVNSVIMGSGTANKIVHIETAGGTEALTFLSPGDYATLLFASAKLKSATTYNVYTGGSVAAAGSTNFNGLYTSGTYTKGTKGASFTTSSVVSQTGGVIAQ